MMIFGKNFPERRYSRNQCLEVGHTCSRRAKREGWPRWRATADRRRAVPQDQIAQARKSQKLPAFVQRAPVSLWRV